MVGVKCFLLLPSSVCIGRGAGALSMMRLCMTLRLLLLLRLRSVLRVVPLLIVGRRSVAMLAKCVALLPSSRWLRVSGAARRKKCMPVRQRLTLLLLLMLFGMTPCALLPVRGYVFLGRVWKMLSLLPSRMWPLLLPLKVRLGRLLLLKLVSVMLRSALALGGRWAVDLLMKWLWLLPISIRLGLVPVSMRLRLLLLLTLSVTVLPAIVADGTWLEVLWKCVRLLPRHSLPV